MQSKLGSGLKRIEMDWKRLWISPVSPYKNLVVEMYLPLLICAFCNLVYTIISVGISGFPIKSVTSDTLGGFVRVTNDQPPGPSNHPSNSAIIIVCRIPSTRLAEYSVSNTLYVSVILLCDRFDHFAVCSNLYRYQIWS